MVPPISAAAMLSRKEDSTNTMHEQHEAALPVVRQEVRQHLGHVAALEMVREQREAEQQAEQVGEDDPLVRQVRREPAEARAGLEPGEAELVDDDGREAGQRDLQRVMVEQRHARSASAPNSTKSIGTPSAAQPAPAPTAPANNSLVHGLSPLPGCYSGCVPSSRAWCCAACAGSASRRRRRTPSRSRCSPSARGGRARRRPAPCRP